MERDKVDSKQAQARMNNQLPQTEKAKYARYIVHNNKGRAELQQELEAVWQQFWQEMEQED